MRVLGNEERVFVRVRELGLDEFLLHPALPEFLGKLFALLIEKIAEPFQEQHSKNIFLILRGIHVPAEVIARTEQKTGELTERQLGHRTHLNQTAQALQGLPRNIEILEVGILSRNIESLDVA